MRASAHDVLGVAPSALRRAVPDIAAVAATVDTTLSHLDSALDAEGWCWGWDAPGMSFLQGYYPLLARARDAFGQLSSAIMDVATNFDSVADCAQSADDRAQRRNTRAL